MGISPEVMIDWESGRAHAILGNFDAPSTRIIGRDLGKLLSAAD